MMRLFQEGKALKEGRENSPKAYLRLNTGSEFPLPSRSAFKLIRHFRNVKEQVNYYWGK